MEPEKRTYHIPNKEVVFSALYNVIRANPAVSSQKKMLFLMLHELREEDQEYTISGPRLRLLAMETDFVSIETRCRETNEKRDLQICPVCNNKTDIIKNQTLYGGSISLEHKCPVCNYWSGLMYRKPTRYRFLLRGKR